MPPLTKKGSKIKKKMQQHYGKEKGKQVFYASQQKGTIKGTHKKKSNPRSTQSKKKHKKKGGMGGGSHGGYGRRR